MGWMRVTSRTGVSPLPSGQPASGRKMHAAL